MLIFKSKETLNKFVESGWEFGGHADAATKAGRSVGELSGEGAIGADIEAYSMTESGLALQATTNEAEKYRYTIRTLKHRTHLSYRLILPKHRSGISVLSLVSFSG